MQCTWSIGDEISSSYLAIVVMKQTNVSFRGLIQHKAFRIQLSKAKKQTTPKNK